MNSTLLFDIESTGLLRRGSRIHCIVARDMQSPDDAMVYDHREDQTLEMGIDQLRNSHALIGHNIISYDIPLIKEQYNFDFQGELIDTLVLSRLFYPNIKDKDFERKPSGMPAKLYGSHSLKAWGFRLRCYKGDFGETNDWATYTPEMLDYCIQDTQVTVKLFELMLRRMKDYE